MPHDDAKHVRPTGQAGDQPGQPDAPALEAEIERTREEVAETVDLLAAKLDVKGRVRDQVSHTAESTKASAAHQLRSAREKATDGRGRPTPAAMSVAAGVAVGVIAVLVVRSRRASTSHRRIRIR